MRALLLTVLAGLAAASTAAAQAPGPNDTATLCLDPGGINHAPICHSQNASRFPTQPDICQCDGPYRQVDAPWCAPGEHSAPDSAALDRARADYAAKHGSSLLGFTFEGHRSCVPQGHGN